jgi:hypothetical protein
MTRQKLFLVLLVATVVTGVAAVGSPASAADSCGQGVEHTFRSSSAVATFNDSQEVTTLESNTRVTVSESSAFVRVAAENPNGYCVSYDVEIDSEIVSPSDLGTVDSVNESVEADWRAVQNFTSGAEYTRVSFTLPAGTSAEFAPSKARVVSLAWATSAKDQGGSLIDSMTGLFAGEQKLDQRTYEITGKSGNRKTVSLTSANSSAEVSDWIGEYRTVDGDWRPLAQDPNSAVYYTQPSKDELRLHYNEDATVRWTANPTMSETISHQWNGYTTGWEGLGSLADSLPF